MNKMLKSGLIAGILITILLFVGGCLPSEAQEEGGNNNMIFMIVLLVFIFALFYFTMIRPQRRRQKQHDTMIQALQKGDKVITAGGIYGTIESLNEENIVLKVESGATIRVARSSVIGRREK